MGNVLCIPRVTKRGDKVKKKGRRRWFWRRRTDRSTSYTSPEASTSADSEKPNAETSHKEPEVNNSKGEREDIHTEVEKNHAPEADSLKKQLEEIKALIIEKIMAIKNLSDENKITTQEIEQLVKTNKELQGRLQEIEVENINLKSENSILEIFDKPTDEGLLMVNKYIMELKEEKQNLSQQLMPYGEMLNDLHMDKKELNDEIKKLKREKGELSKKAGVININ